MEFATMKKILFALLGMVFISSVHADKIKIAERYPLIKKRLTLQAGEKQLFKGGRLKTTDKKWGNKRVGLRIKAIALSKSYNGGWTMIMQLKVNGKIVDRFNADKQPRLINRPDTKQLTGGPNKRYSGSAWYDKYMKSWDVGYGENFMPPKEFNPYFKEDITDYIFDIDDLVEADYPVEVELINVADKSDGLVKLMQQQKRKFPLAAAKLELVIFENPANRGAASKNIALPSAGESQAMRDRIRKFEEFSTAEAQATLAEIKRSQKLFGQCERHTRRGHTEPGHLWIQYVSNYKNADSFIPLLDEAKKSGVGVVKVHSYWADINKTSPFRPANQAAEADYRKLIKLCHDRGLKFIAYVSPAWVKLNKDYNTAWEFSDKSTAPDKPVKWGQVCTGSPEWRNYFFSNVQKMFNDYPIDGIYVDIGVNNAEEARCTKKDHIHAFTHDVPGRASSKDMINRLYSLCRKNNKLMYLFAESHDNFEDICDMQYVGESTPSMAAHVDRHRKLKGNIFFLPMYHGFTYYSPREVYAYTMVLGHFPLASYSEQKTWNMEFTWFKHFLGIWSAMSKDGTHIYRDVKKSPLIKNAPAGTMLTAFVNTDTYLVVANFGNTPVEYVFTQTLEDMENGKKSTSFTISERDFRIFRMAFANN